MADFDPFAALGAQPVAAPAAPAPTAPAAQAAPASGDAAPAQAAQFQVVAPHPAPDGNGMTNLSDEDFAKFKAGVAPTPPAPAPAKGKDFDPFAAVGAQPAAEAPSAPAQPDTPPQQAPTPAPTTPATPQQQPGFIESLADALHGIPRGLVGGKTVDYTDAALQTPIRMLTGMQGPSAAFNEGLAQANKENDRAAQAPISSVGGELLGGAAGGAMMAPALGWEAASGLIPKLGSAASYIGKNASFGGLMSILSGGDPTTGAVLGAALPGLHVAGSTLSAPVRALASKLMPLVSQGAREASVGRTLGGVMGNTPIESSPVGPLDLAQATNNPEVVARVDLAPSYNASANANLRSAQQDAINDQIAKIGAPASQADASSAFTNAIRNARGVAGTEENRLWTVPELAQTKVSAQPVAQAVNDAVQNMDPVLRDSMSPQLRALVNRVNGTDTTTIRDLNGIRSDFAQIGRSSADGAERSMARTLSDAFMGGLDQVPEVAGNPDIKTAYQAARDYTRQMRGMFGQPDAAALTAKNASGAYRVESSEGLKAGGRFFNFSNGSPEGPQSITQLSDFIATLKQPGAAQVAGEMKDAARSYVAASLVKAARAGEGQNFNPKTMQDFLRQNGGWIQTSGLFTGPQVQAARDLMDYAAMLRRPEQLLRQTNSATQPRSARAGTFIDEIMSPWIQRAVSIGGMVAGGSHHGVLGAGAGMMGGAAVHSAVANAESAMREMMAEALLNPRVAQELRMKASAANLRLLSPETRQLIGALRSAAGNDLSQHSSPLLQQSHVPELSH